ncbi:MAX gene-associated protein [Ambystoma mexicanum]|uniref:MAX gene-associated protein n=1 Tax=Ambystoma mexicanum TaxID=8296 RepID=UPI0037E9A259
MTEKQLLPTTMENSQPALAKPDNVSASREAPSFFVLVPQPQASDKSEEGILVSEQGVDPLSSSSPASGTASVPSTMKSKDKSSLAADCKIADITVVLDNNTMWNEFYRRRTEMILTKQGRRMFPYCRYWISGLDPNLKYILVMDIAPVDNHRYKWNGRWWESSGKAEPHVLGRVFIHPESPSTGQYWMHQPVSFYKLKLTNNYLDQEGHIILHSMHRYLPRLHLVPADRATEVIQLNGPDVHTFTFPQTEFFAVTAYQNFQITQLKIDYNPFAKGFREDAFVSRPLKEIVAKGRSDLESTGTSSSPGPRGLVNNEWLDNLKKAPVSLSESQDQLDSDVDKESCNAERDCLDLLDTDLPAGARTTLKHEALHSSVPSSFEGGSLVASPLGPSVPASVVIKEEPVDDFDYERSVSTDGVVVKQEDSEEEDTDVYSNSDDDYPILERQLMKQSAMDQASLYGPKKRPMSSPSGVVKAKMSKLNTDKLPVVFTGPCSNSTGIVNSSELNIVSPDNQHPQPLSPDEQHQPPLSPDEQHQPPLSPDEQHQPPLSPDEHHQPPLSLDEHHQPPLSPDEQYQSPVSQDGQQQSADNEMQTSLSLSVEESSITSIKNVRETRGMKNTVSNDKKQLKFSTPKEAEVKNSEPTQTFGRPRKSNLITRETQDSLVLSRDARKRKSSSALKDYTTLIDPADIEITPPASPVRRGRPRKSKVNKMNKVSPQTKKSFGRFFQASKDSILANCSPFANVNLDLEDVDGVLFVSFVSKEALDIHTVDKPVGRKGLQNSPTPLPGVEDTDNARKIKQLEEELLEDLMSLRHKQVIHPALQEVGLKLGVVDPSVSIDLRYLGVQLPLAYFSGYGPENKGLPDTEHPFISRTGKTNDFTKIKGWRDKFSTNTPPKSEGSTSGGPMKNRSAFCSDKLDEYLENEAKLMDTDLDLVSSVDAPVVSYQLPIKSTSYVRTLDSVLKKQPTPAPSGTFTLKPLSSLSGPKRPRPRNKPASASTKAKRAYRRILPSPVLKEKTSMPNMPVKTPKHQPVHLQARQENMFLLPIVEDSLFPRQINLAQAQQQQLNSARPPGISKSYLKLFDLEECAVWDGKSRTYITEERADISLATLLTAQVSLKNRPVRKIIRRRAPACNNEFCRLGCVCFSLSQEKRQPTHCRRPECMFGCTCLKRKMLLVKGGLKDIKNIKNEGEVDLQCEPDLDKDQSSDRKNGDESEEENINMDDEIKNGKLEYTICDADTEEPVRRSFSIWEKGEIDEDPEPIYIPTPSVIEPVKSGASESMPSLKNKHGRVYTPKPNPVIRDEDKDPVYLYFENMMTCARVRTYKRKTIVHKQEEIPMQCTCRSNQCTAKVHDPLLGPKTKSIKIEKSMVKPIDRYKLARSKPGTTTSRVHKITSGGPTKLIEIISDCNWEEDRDNILNILSQKINSNMPRSLKIGNFIVELGSENRSRDEKNPPFVSSRVKISMPSSQDEDGEISASEIAHFSSISSRDKVGSTTLLEDDPSYKLQEKSNSCKGLPFYTGLSPAGKLIANKHEADLNPSELIQVNGKSYPQAKLLLGQMGALHPANRLAAYITGRLRPTVLDLSTLSTVISKVTTSKTCTTATTLTTTSISKPSVTLSTASTTASSSSAFTIAAARPSINVFKQFMMNKVGTLPHTIPIVGTPQTTSGSKKLNANPTSFMVVTPVASSRSCQVFTTTPSTKLSTLTMPSSSPSAVLTAATQVSKENANEAVSPVTLPINPALKEITLSSPSFIQSPIGFGVTLASPTLSTTSPKTILSPTGTTTKATVVKLPTAPITPLTPLSFARTLISASTIPLPVTTTASPSLLSPAKAATVVTTSGSTIGSVPILLSGMSSLGHKQGIVSQAAVAVSSASVLSPGSDRLMGPRLLLIPVPAGTQTLRHAQNAQAAQGQKTILQPFRNPGGVNLFRHPNGQIVQLVPLQQVRAAGAQPKLKPLLLRNPGSVMGIQLPLPTKVADASKPLTTSASSFVLATPPVSAPVANLVPSTCSPVTQPTTSISSVPSFVSQAGTLTLRISPPTTSSLALGQTSPNSKIITYSSAGQPMGSASLIPLQSGSFALLQLPGHKTVPSSILNHAATLQLLKDTQTASQKEQPDLSIQSELKTSPEMVATELKDLLPESESEKTVVCDPTNVETDMQEELPPSVPRMNHNTVPGVLDHTVMFPENNVQSKVPIETALLDDSGEKECLLDLHRSEMQKDNREHIHKKDPECFSELKDTPESSSPLASSNAGDHQSSLDKEGSEETGSSGQLNSSESTHVKENKDTVHPLTQNKNISTLLAEKQNELMPDGESEKAAETQDPEVAYTLNPGHRGNQVNADQALCLVQDDNRSGGSSREAVHMSKKVDETCGLGPLVTGTPHVVEAKHNHIAQECFDGNHAESRVSERGRAASIDLQNSLSLVSETVTNEKKEMANKQVEVGNSSTQMFAPAKEKESSELKKTLVLINIDDEKEDDEDEEDDKSDESADDPMEDSSSDEEDVNVDVDTDEQLISKDDEEQVDIETVEELSDKINIARLKATATHISTFKHRCNIHIPPIEKVAEKDAEKDDKKLSNWKKKPRIEAVPFAGYRESHTANERRRRHEMRTLFENLQKILGLNLPKVSKCFILGQAYEEIQGLTDQADKLIGQKTLLTRKQELLIRKVSALSGKTEEVILKKLEYIYAKQKALDAERKKRQLGEEELAQQLRPSRLLKQDISLETFRHVEQLTLASHKPGKPLILSRKPMHAEEPATSRINLNAASVMVTPQGQVFSLKNSHMPAHVTSVPSTIFQADMSSQATCKPLKTQQGITSMMIQLPGSSVPIQVKGLLSSSSVPLTLSTSAKSTIEPSMAAAAQHSTENETFLMPKIVNVTSLASDPGMSVNPRVAKPSLTTSAFIKAPDKPLRSEAKIGENNVLGKAVPVSGRSVAEHIGNGSFTTEIQQTQVSMNSRKPSSAQMLNVDYSKNAEEHSFLERNNLGIFEGHRKENNAESVQLKVKDASFLKLLSKDIKDSKMVMELKQVASTVGEGVLNQSELMSSIEHDETDETLTSLLNEIAFLNQQLNNDTPNSSVTPELSVGDSESHRGDEVPARVASSVRFGSFNELFEVSENKRPISPLLLHLEQGDLHTEQCTSNVVSPKDSLQLNSNENNNLSGFETNTASVSPPPTLQKNTKQESGSTDALWRPMPKLAPLGLKVSHLSADQEGQGNKVMPPLAPVTTKLGPLWIKAAVPATEQGQVNKAMPTLLSVVAKQNSDNALPTRTTDQ